MPVLNSDLKTLLQYLTEWFKFFQKHKHDVKVTNFPNIKIKDYDKRLQSIENGIRAIKSSIDGISFPEFPETISVSNLPEPLAFPEFPRSFNIENFPEFNFPTFPDFPESIKISNLEDIVFPKQSEIRFPEFPENVSISNFPENQTISGNVTIDNLYELNSNFQAVVDSIDALKREITSLPFNNTSVVGTGGGQSLHLKDSGPISTSNPLPISIISGGSTSTEYTEGDIDPTFTGSVVLAEGPSNTATPLQVDASKHLQVDIAADSVGLTVQQYTEGATDTTITGVAMMIETDSGTSTLGVVGALNLLPVSVEVMPTVEIGDVAGVVTVNVTSTGTGFPVAFSDDATPAGDIGVVMAGFRFDDSTPNTVDENDVGYARMSSRREVYTQIRDAAGNERGVNVNASNQLEVNTELPDAVTLADNSANPTAPSVGAHNLVWDNSNSDWELARKVATNVPSTGIPAAGIMGMFDDTTPTSTTENQFSPIRMSANRNMYTTIRDAAGNERGVNVTASNALSVDTGLSVSALLTTTDFTTVFGTASLILATQADNVANTSDGLQTSSFLYVFDGTAWDRLPGNSTDGATVNLGSNNDVSINAGTNLIGKVSASVETSTVYDGTTALTPKFAVIDAATSGDNTLVSNVASKKIRVLSCFIVAAGAVNARFESGAGGTALSGQMNLTTNSGFVLPFNPTGWFETASNTLLNLELSGAVSVDGSLVYVEV